MLYYRVKDKYGGRNLIQVSNGRQMYTRYKISGIQLIPRELVTANEYRAMCKLYRLWNGCKIDIAFEPVEIKRTHTFWYFGVRFEITPD